MAAVLGLKALVRRSALEGGTAPETTPQGGRRRRCTNADDNHDHSPKKKPRRAHVRKKKENSAKPRVVRIRVMDPYATEESSDDEEGGQPPKKRNNVVKEYKVEIPITVVNNGGDSHDHDHNQIGKAESSRRWGGGGRGRGRARKSNSSRSPVSSLTTENPDVMITNAHNGGGHTHDHDQKQIGKAESLGRRGGCGGGGTRKSSFSRPPVSSLTKENPDVMITITNNGGSHIHDHNHNPVGKAESLRRRGGSRRGGARKSNSSGPPVFSLTKRNPEVDYKNELCKVPSVTIMANARLLISSMVENINNSDDRNVDGKESKMRTRPKKLVRGNEEDEKKKKEERKTSCRSLDLCCAESSTGGPMVLYDIPGPIPDLEMLMKEADSLLHDFFSGIPED